MTSNSPLPLLGGLSAADFLQQYWQKKPLLIRQAIPGYQCPISPDELAGLACEEEVESRLILEKGGEHPWQLEHGPLAEERFTSLPEHHWTLLVQEINKHVPEFALLQDQFNFIPSWRLDDVMVSYAPPQGSVGPHSDTYDVFLLQGMGKRRWQINPAAPTANELIPGLPLRIIQDFQAEEEWVLEPGDMLYLPPGVSHHGVAVDDCMTISIGFRAPSHQAILGSLMETLIEQQDSNGAYSDPDLLPQQNPGEITLQAREKIRHFIRQQDFSDETIDHWFGEFITETKPGHDIPLPEELTKELTAEDIRIQLLSGTSLWHSEHCRMAYFEDTEKTIKLFAGGEEIGLPASLTFAAPLLCQQRVFCAEELHLYIDKPGFLELLATLYNKGALTLLDNEYD